MSELTLDEAIKHCLEMAEENEAKAQKIGVQFLGTTKDREATECRECAADHRQLAEWLTDYKKSQEELAEAKRLLKLAICELGDAQDCDSCIADCSIGTDCTYKWHCSNEAEKLING